MTFVKSTDFRRSRYVHGGITDVHPTRLGWWKRTPIPKADDDIFITINSRYHKRPWMVAHDYYTEHNYEWLILQYNSILDINDEFVIGKVIRIPSPQRLGLEIMTRQVGGKPVRE